jgi:GH35 family endo-1,4-beta-xylanase
MNASDPRFGSTFDSE